MTITTSRLRTEIVASLAEFDAPDVIEAVESAHEVRAAVAADAVLVALRSSHRHPDLWRLRLATLEPLRGGVAESRFSDLWPHVRDSREPGQVFAIFETDHRFAPPLLAQLGFSAVRSHTGTMPVARFDSPSTEVPDGLSMRRCANLSASHVDWYEATYDRCHRWAGRYERYHDDTPWVSFCGPVVPGGVVEVCDEAGKLHLVVSLHRSDGDGGEEPFLAVAEPDSSRASQAFDAALTMLVDAVVEANAIRWEADSTYPHLWEWVVGGPHQLTHEFAIWHWPPHAVSDTTDLRVSDTTECL